MKLLKQTTLMMYLQLLYKMFVPNNTVIFVLLLCYSQYGWDIWIAILTEKQKDGQID